MRSLSACLCVVDGMTVMHNLERGEKHAALPPPPRLSDHIHSPFTVEEPPLFPPELPLNSFISCFGPPPPAFLLEQMSHCTIVFFFFLEARSLVLPSPCSLGLVQGMSRLRSSRLTTSRPIAGINLSPLFLPVEQD